MMDKELVKKVNALIQERKYINASEFAKELGISIWDATNAISEARRIHKEIVEAATLSLEVSIVCEDCGSVLLISGEGVSGEDGYKRIYFIRSHKCPGKDGG